MQANIKPRKGSNAVHRFILSFSAEFKRLCGVSRNTFRETVEVLRPHLESQGRRGGQAKLSVADQLLVALEKGARVSQPVSYRDELGRARDHCGADNQEGRRLVGQVW